MSQRIPDFPIYIIKGNYLYGSVRLKMAYLEGCRVSGGDLLGLKFRRGKWGILEGCGVGGIEGIFRWKLEKIC